MHLAGLSPFLTQFHAEDPLKKGFHFLIPLGILIYVLVNNYSPIMAGFIAVVSVFALAMVRRATRMSLKDIIEALELGAKNAITVSVACAAAGIVVGMVSLTGMGLKFSSFVVSLSHGIPLLAILLIGLASLVLGMGLPVTASYIVLVILAGPALTGMGVALVTAHMIVFWYSQDANVTPPVSLASFAATGVAGANPMRCAFASWKIAQGALYHPDYHGVSTPASQWAFLGSGAHHCFCRSRPRGLHGIYGGLSFSPNKPVGVAYARCRGTSDVSNGPEDGYHRRCPVCRCYIHAKGLVEK